MQAIALQNNVTGDVVIAYEGMNLNTWQTNGAMISSQIAAAKQIEQNSTSPLQANLDAFDFAVRTQNAANGHPIYVTGHSLGGEEAEYVQARADQPSSGLAIAGGASFGAPGVPGLQASDPNQNFTRYFDSGDVIGHFNPGTATVGVEHPFNRGDQTAEVILATFGGALGLAAAAGLALQDHFLTTYARDLGVILQYNQSTTGLGVADLMVLGKINGTSLFGSYTSPQFVNGNLVVNGDTLAISSNLTTLTLNNGETVHIATGNNVSKSVPTSGSLSFVSALPNSTTNTAEIVNSALGTTSYYDLLGNTFASYDSSELSGANIKVNGSKIETYNSDNQLRNSTQEIEVGNGVSGVIDKTYSFTNFTPLGSQAPIPYGISDSGKIVGIQDISHSFLDDNGTVTQVGPAYAQDVNDSGIIVGYQQGASNRGWQIVNGTFSYIVNPNDAPAQPDPFDQYSYNTYVTGINNAGVIVGFSYVPYISYQEGFIDDNGTFTHVASNPWGVGNRFMDINNNGVIAGNGYSSPYQIDAFIGGEGFIYDNGSFTKIIAPDADGATQDAKWDSTFVTGISDDNIVVGTFAYGPNHTSYRGFVDIDGVFTMINYPGANNTFITDINSNNEIVGFAEFGTNIVGFKATLSDTVTSNFYLEVNGAVDLSASSELVGATVKLVAGNNNVTFGENRNIVNGALGATQYNFGTVFAQDVIDNAFGGNSAANGEIDFTSSTITKQNLWLTQSGNDLLIRKLGTTQTITLTGWFGSSAGAKVAGIKLSDGLQLTPTRVATLVAAMATYQSAHSSFNPATASTMPTDTTLQNAITAAWNKYDTITTNLDGTWTGTLNDHTGANWTYQDDNYTAAGLLDDSYQQMDDNGHIVTDYNLSGADGWKKGVHITDSLGREAENIITYEDDSYDDIVHFFSGPIRAIDNYYDANNVLLDTFQDNFDDSSIETAYNPSGEGGWTKGIHYKNSSGQDTEDDIYYEDGSHDDTVYNDLSGGNLHSTKNYILEDNTLVNTQKNFNDGTRISIDYDNGGEDWITGSRCYDASDNLLQTDVLYEGDSHWMYVHDLNTTLAGGTGYNGYEFEDAGFGNDTINNGGGTSAHGEIDFDDSGITDEKLWFKQVGSDLTVQKLGSSNKITIAGWYTSGQAGNQVESFHADGLTLDTQVAQLVNAMATYQTGHSSFNPNTATSMPTDTTLQNAITAAWHS
jgi:hypothetical protein